MALSNISSIYIRGNEPEAGVIDLSTVTSIVGGYQFDSGATYVTKFILSDDLTGYIGDKFLTTNKAMTELTIPAGVTSLANRSISGNSALKKLTILGRATTIGGDALVYSASSSTKLDIIYGRIGSPAANFAQSKGIAFADLTGDRYDGEVTFSGDCGNGVYFKLIENDTADTYTLYFYGTGTEIINGNTATELNAPWADYADKITKVVYRGSIESMGDYNVFDFSGLNSISANYFFTSAKKLQYVRLPALQYVRLPANIGTSARGMFNNNAALKAVSFGSAELVTSLRQALQASAIILLKMSIILLHLSFLQQLQHSMMSAAMLTGMHLLADLMQ